MYDFDKPTNRRNTDGAKWNVGHMLTDEKMIPLWVADMDFEVLPEIKEALLKRVDHAIFGYSMPSDEYLKSVAGWMDRRHDWKIETDWIVPFSGIVPALNACVNVFTKPEDEILIFKPVYYPFDRAILGNNRKVSAFELELKDGQYQIDFEKLEKHLQDHNIKMTILCSPHNPIGRVWTQQELEKMGELFEKYNVMVVSDEIHMDLQQKGHKHIPFVKACPQLTDNTIVCTAPSKTFNIAGLHSSNLIIPNEEIRTQLTDYMSQAGLNAPDLLALTACQAAYTYGDQWVDELNEYLAGNIAYMKDWFAQNYPMIEVIDPQGLYLVWVDFRKLGLSGEELEKMMLEEAHLWLDEGYIFGAGGEGFERFNVGCQRATLQTALNQLGEALSKRGY